MEGSTLGGGCNTEQFFNSSLSEEENEQIQIRTK